MDTQIIAKRYAGALFSAVGGADSREIWDELNDLSELTETSPEFADIIRNPVISAEDKIAVFSELRNKNRISETLFNFLSLLVEKNRLFLLPSINAEIKKLLLDQRGEMEAEAVFAVEPDGAVKNELEKRLSALTGKKVLLKEVVDPSVIGGVKVRMGSVLYDATVKGEIDRLKETLI